MSEWIACGDRLPDEGEWYLGFDCKESLPPLVTMAFFDGIVDGRAFWLPLFDGNEDDLNITHWMPLPEPPGEITWKAGWYADRLHAVENGDTALCGFIIGTVPDADWRRKRLAKELPKCKRCLKKVGQTPTRDACSPSN